jgi:hypothetical protein
MNKWKRTWLIIVMIVVMTPLILSNTKASDYDQTLDVKQSTEITETVYIHQLSNDASGMTMTMEPIEWYQGEAARRAFATHEPDADLDGPPDDYYIVNNNKPLETYTIAPNATVNMQIYDRTGQLEDIDIQENESITLNKFNKIFAQKDNLDLSNFPYHITIKDGQVTSIVQQYIP